MHTCILSKFNLIFQNYQLAKIDTDEYSAVDRKQIVCLIFKIKEWLLKYMHNAYIDRYSCKATSILFPSRSHY